MTACLASNCFILFDPVHFTSTTLLRLLYLLLLILFESILAFSNQKMASNTDVSLLGARSYQVEMFERSMKGNMIVAVLPSPFTLSASCSCSR